MQEGSSMAGQEPSAHQASWAERNGTAASGVEQPTQAAELNVTVGPATAGGRVPQGDAHHFITVGGIAWCVGAAIAGVVLTLQIAGRSPRLGAGSGPVVLALAELTLGLAGAAFIAVHGRRAASRRAASRRGTSRRTAQADGRRKREQVTGPARKPGARADRHDSGAGQAVTGTGRSSSPPSPDRR
jgi:hypothetical protein